jgi:hypothetical protein
MAAAARNMMKIVPFAPLAGPSILLALTAIVTGTVSPVRADTADFVIAGTDATPVLVDADDYTVVSLAANLYADDVQRVTGKRPLVFSQVPSASKTIPRTIIAGTLGHSALIDRLAAQGRLKRLSEIKGRWEASLAQVVDHPLPGVDRALVLAGSDRRGTAYGLMRLSEKIGVSPWYWWADVPVKHRNAVTVNVPSPQIDAPGVKYRGIFINDEDWGFAPWAKNTLDPEFHNVGPKTYARVFELMLRLRLNYLWPAMHLSSKEFGSIPENVTLADKYAIVAGASHCEPMLYNNIRWSVKEKGAWNYGTNRDSLFDIWQSTAKERGNEEAVWTLGIRGIHDRGMEGPKEMPERISLVSRVIQDQRSLLAQNVTKQWGPIAQCFVPYKEVQPIYDAGLEVPPDVTLVWADDNFGYLRRLSSPTERKRPGGAGFYYHLSYYGTPHSYTWINTTAPALMWEEMHKAWENEARTIWVVNVGDIKPMEIGIDFLAKLAWNPDDFRADSQPAFLRDFAAQNFGPQAAQPIADLLAEFYRLGTLHKPELMRRSWALSLSPEQAATLHERYHRLQLAEEALAEKISPEYRDAYTEIVGYPVRMLAATGLLFLADRSVQHGKDSAKNQAEVERLHAYIDAQTRHYNQEVAGGKWNLMMSGPMTARKSIDWSSLVRWPWYENPLKPGQTLLPYGRSVAPPDSQRWRDAAAYSRKSGQGKAEWTSVAGLGPTGRAMTLKPATLENAWSGDAKESKAPRLEYDFLAKDGDADAFLDFLPTFRIYPGMKLRVGVQVDNGAVTLFDVPGSSGTEDENGEVRRFAVQDNYTRLRVPLPRLTAGKHTFKIRAVDPGAVLDRLSLPDSAAR